MTAQDRSKKVIKYSGNGTVIIKTWFALVSFLVFFAGLAINIFSFIKYDPVKVCVDENTEAIKENKKSIEVLQRNEAVNFERYEWTKSMLIDISKKIDKIYEDRMR